MRYAYGCVGILAVSAIAYSITAPPSAAANRFRSLRDAIIDANSPTVAARALKDLFKTSSDESLLALKADPHLTVALHAAHWMQDSPHPHFVAASHPERFIGFLEGRTGFTCPPNWASSFVMEVDRQQSGLDRRSYLSGALQSYGALGLVNLEDVTLGLKPGEGIPSTSVEIHPYRTVQYNDHTIRCPSTMDIKNGRFVLGTR